MYEEYDSTFLACLLPVAFLGVLAAFLPAAGVFAIVVLLVVLCFGFAT